MKVREVLMPMCDDGCLPAAVRGSHRRFKIVDEVGSTVLTG